MNARFALLLPIALLAACEKSEDPTRVSIRTGDVENGAAADDGSVFSIDTNGFKANIQVPGLAGLSDRMKIDGVRLYPESRVSAVNIAEAGESGGVTLQFTAPADRAKVGGWFADQFKENGFAAEATAKGYAGTTADGDRFTLTLADAPAGTTRGAFSLGERR
jgi:hypothetical protein